MKINITTKGVIITAKQKSQMERQLMRLKKYVRDIEPITINLKLIDQTGPEKGGVDQAVHINVMLPKDKIFIEEVDDRIVRAFQYAYKILERRLRRYVDKMVGERRRQGSRFKAIYNVAHGAGRVVGGAGRVVYTAAGAVVRIVPRRRKKRR